MSGNRSDTERRWTIRACSECGQECHIGQLYHWHGDFPGNERFPVEEVEVIPADSDNVLSKEECRLLVDIAAEKYHHGDDEYSRFDELLNRLADHAKGAAR